MEKIIKAVLVCLVLFQAGMAGDAGSSESSGKIIQRKFEKIRNEISKEAPGPKSSTGADTKIKTSHAGEITAGSFIKMIFGLIFIIILVVLSIRGLKKFQNSSLVRKRTGKQDYMEVLETCYLGNDQKVVVLKIQDAVSVLGVTPHGINMLKDLAAAPARPAIPAETAPDANERPELFSNNLNYFLRNFSKPKTVEQTLKEL